MITEKQIQENKEYLDRIALETSNIYVTTQRPNGFSNSMSVARLSYVHALAMLEVRENSLGKLAQDNKILSNKK